MPTLQMTEVRLREVKWLVHTHTGPSGAAGLRPAIPGGETQAKTQRGAEASSWSTSSCDSSLLPPQNWVWTQEPPFQGLIHHQPSDPKLDPTLFYFVTISFLQPMRKTATPLQTLGSLHQDFLYQSTSPHSGHLLQLSQQGQNKLTVPSQKVSKCSVLPKDTSTSGFYTCWKKNQPQHPLWRTRGAPTMFTSALLSLELHFKGKPGRPSRTCSSSQSFSMPTLQP